MIAPRIAYIHIARSHQPTQRPNIAKEPTKPTQGRQKKCGKLKEKMTEINEHQAATKFINHWVDSANFNVGKIYKTDELEVKSTCAKIAQVQKEGDREIKRKFKYYNLVLLFLLDNVLNQNKEPSSGFGQTI